MGQPSFQSNQTLASKRVSGSGHYEHNRTDEQHPTLDELEPQSHNPSPTKSQHESPTSIVDKLKREIKSIDSEINKLQSELHEAINM